jgi:hemerythrin
LIKLRENYIFEKAENHRVINNPSKNDKYIIQTKLYKTIMKQGISIPDWEKKYNIGIDLVDFQHQYFLKLIKRFSEHLDDDISDYMFDRLINEIIKYADFHFQSEENLMIIEGYPEYRNHQEIHKDLIEDIGTILYYYSEGEKETSELVEFLLKWFFDHTAGDDMKFGKYIKQRDGDNN